MFASKEFKKEVDETVLGSSIEKDIPNLSKGKDPSKKVTSCNESEEEDLGNHHIIFNEHDDLNLWMERRQQNINQT